MVRHCPSLHVTVCKMADRTPARRFTDIGNDHARHGIYAPHPGSPIPVKPETIVDVCLADRNRGRMPESAAYMSGLSSHIEICVTCHKLSLRRKTSHDHHLDKECTSAIWYVLVKARPLTPHRSRPDVGDFRSTRKHRYCPVSNVHIGAGLYSALYWTAEVGVFGGLKVSDIFEFAAGLSSRWRKQSYHVATDVLRVSLGNNFSLLAMAALLKGML